MKRVIIKFENDKELTFIDDTKKGFEVSFGDYDECHMVILSQKERVELLKLLAQSF